MLDNKSTTDQVGRLDHSISSEYRILRPPGTGKTTSIQQVGEGGCQEGTAVIRSLVTSFSRGAAAELANCDLTIPPERLEYSALDLLSRSGASAHRRSPREGLEPNPSPVGPHAPLNARTSSQWSRCR